MCACVGEGKAQPGELGWKRCIDLGRVRLVFVAALAQRRTWNGGFGSEEQCVMTHGVRSDKGKMLVAREPVVGLLY